MAGIVVLAFFITTSLSVIEAKKAYKLSARRDGPVDEPAESCVPGKFSRGPGCGTCFCNANKAKVCTPPGTCKVNEKVPTKEQLIRAFNKAKLHLLPSLPNTGAECSPGMSYRVDCNRCLCDNAKSLVCDALLCPTYDEINIHQAMKMSGKPCEDGDVKNQECVKCLCDDGKYECEAKDGCISSVALLKLQRGTKTRQRCDPGKTYPNPNGGPPCTCPIHNKLVCPRGKELTNTRKPRSRNTQTQFKPRKMPAPPPRGADGMKEMLFDKAFLDPNTKKKCTPGVVYHDKCNRCTCSDERLLFCTTMLCLKDTGLDPGAPLRKRKATRKKKISTNTSMVALDKKKKCIPGRSYSRDCNRCRCTKDGNLSCTKMICGKDMEKGGTEEKSAEV